VLKHLLSKDCRFVGLPSSEEQESAEDRFSRIAYPRRGAAHHHRTMTLAR
jgi:hypothetical protein